MAWRWLQGGWMLRRKAGFFAFLSTVYLLILGALLLARKFHWLGVDRLDARLGGIIPLAIPWFGALGAVAISLYGIFDHGGASWDNSYNYWHVLRPFMGAILGTLAYLIFIGFINATTTGTTTTGGTTITTTNPIPTTAVKTIPYLVIAFVVGFRESTFRHLIARVVDVILGPGIPGVTPPTGIAVSPSPIEFGNVTRNTASDPIVVHVSNTGAGNLVIHKANDDPPGVALAGERFSLQANSVDGAVIPPNTEATVSVVFTPPDAKLYAATLTIHSNAGTRTVELSGTGTPP
jgi:hypothetical protein